MQRPEVRAFKNELRNYTYYCSRIASLEESIEFMYDRLGGVRGIDPSKEPIHSAPDKEFEYMLRDKISSLEQDKAVYEVKRDYIDLILGRIENTLREALKLVYIDGQRLDRVSGKFFLTPNGLIYRLNKSIEEALK